MFLCCLFIIHARDLVNMIFDELLGEISPNLQFRHTWEQL